MRRFTRHYKRLRYVRLRVAMIVILLNILALPSWVKYVKDEADFYRIFLNGEEVGCLGNIDDLDSMYTQARRTVAGEHDGILYMDADLTYESSSVIFSVVDDKKDVQKRMTEVLRKSENASTSVGNDSRYVHGYTMKIGDYMVNLSSVDDICEVLQAALDRFMNDGSYKAVLERDPGRELNVLTAMAQKMAEEEYIYGVEPEDDSLNGTPAGSAGFEAFIENAVSDTSVEKEDKGFADYTYGLMEMSFDDNIEVVDCYLLRDQIASIEDAIDSVVTMQEVNTVYEVVSGDTLSGIAIKTNIPMDKIIELNDSLENENSLIRPGDELIVTTIEPPLAIRRTEREYIEEFYDAEIEYIYNDEWYTTDRVTRRQPSTGRRNIVAETTYVNSKSVERTILKEELVVEAVAKVVEVGTKVPPTYIKPLSGGRMSSGFGRRNRPTKGASTNHQGVDWATPVGTTIFASCGGTVTRAGWGKGYGYCVYIKHPDGKETRYGHLSKILVSVGQTVSQGQKIALSGNTGVSTGPHLHFEIRIGGAAVNPLKYLN